MKIIKKDLKMNLKSSIIWLISIGSMSFFVVSIYDSLIASNAEQWIEMLESFPEPMLEAFQITEMTFNDILSYYAMEGYLYIGLMLAIYAALLGAKLINGEESNKTIEFILTKPISRAKYITQKLATLLLSVTSMNLINTTVLYIGMIIGTNEKFSMNDFAMYAIGTYLISLCFGLLAFMLACILKRNKNMSGMTIGIVFASFFLGIISQLADKVDFLKYFSLFEYANPNELLTNGFSFLSIAVFTSIIITTIFISYFIYTKKDIYN